MVGASGRLVGGGASSGALGKSPSLPRGFEEAKRQAWLSAGRASSPCPCASATFARSGAHARNLGHAPAASMKSQKFRRCEQGQRGVTLTAPAKARGDSPGPPTYGNRFIAACTAVGVGSANARTALLNAAMNAGS